ncbi:MAG: hypothetical protein ABEH65_06600 [Halobacteriales archaeon]
MKTRKVLGVGVTVLFLIGFLTAGNVLVAAHLTILDPDYVSESIAETDGYDRIHTQLYDHIATGISDTADSDPVLPVNRTAVIADSLNRSYVATQGNQLLTRFYAYLHGHRSDPGLYLNLEPVKTRTAQRLEAQIRALQPSTLAIHLLNRTDRTELTSAEPAADGNRSDDSRLINRTLIAQLDEGPAAYRTAQDQVRTSFRERIIDQAVAETFNRSSQDELLALVIEDYDPTAYSEAEKDQLIDDREDEIRAELEARIRTQRGDEIDATVDRRLERFYNQSRRGNASEYVANESIATGIDTLQETIVAALTTDLSYRAYRDRATRARDQIATGIGAVARSQLDEQFPDRLQLMQRVVPGDQERLSTAATVVRWIDRVTIVLPIIVLVLLGVLWRLTGSIRLFAGLVGGSLVLVSLPVMVGLPVLRFELIQGLPSGPMGDIGRSVLDGFLGTWRAQSLSLLGVGVVFLLVSIERHYGIVDR